MSLLALGYQIFLLKARTSFSQSSCLRLCVTISLCQGTRAVHRIHANFVLSNRENDTFSIDSLLFFEFKSVLRYVLDLVARAFGCQYSVR